MRKSIGDLFMNNRNLIFGQKLIRAIVAPLIAASLTFGCKKPKEEPLSRNPIVAELQLASRYSCKLGEGSVRFRDRSGATFRVHDGQEIDDEHGNKIKIMVRPRTDGSSLVYIIEPSGVSHPKIVRAGCI